MSKTPFELRFEALCLARGMLVEEYQAKIGITGYLHETQRADYVRAISYPTEEDILALAQRLKNFVDDRAGDKDD